MEGCAAFRRTQYKFEFLIKVQKNISMVLDTFVSLKVDAHLN